MEKTYKVISEFANGKISIKQFNAPENAIKAYFKAIKKKCKNCCLLEEDTKQSTAKKSYNKILSKYKNSQL